MYTREASPQDWARTQNNLGLAFCSQGQREEGEEGLWLLEKAVEAYGEALTIRTREALPQQWAMTQYNLGIALSSQGEQLGGEEGMLLLSQAVEAHQQALTVYTRETQPQQWVKTQYVLGETYILLKDWPNVAKSFGNVLTLYPRNERAYRVASTINHEALFNYPEAFRLHQQWLGHSKSVPSAEFYYAETHFTTARFSECEQHIAKLLAKPDLEGNVRIILQAIEIANLLAMGKSDLVSAKIDLLIAVVASQQPDFRGKGRFDGTRHFIGQHEKLASHRAWLDQLFEAIGGSDREAILKGLREVQAKFKQ